MSVIAIVTITAYSIFQTHLLITRQVLSKDVYHAWIEKFSSSWSLGPKVIKLFFMFNSTAHKK